MRNFKIFTLAGILATLALAVLLTACGEGKEVRIKSAELARDYNQGEAIGVSTTFKATDPAIHCVVKMGGEFYGAKIKIVWTAVDTADGSKNKSLLEDEFTIYKELDTYDLTYRPQAGGAFATGKYKTEVYLNGKVDKTLDFTVQ